MFDLSLAELALILLVAVVFIGPKELPALIRAVSRFMKGLRDVMKEVRKAFDDLAEESGMKDEAKQLEADVKMIQGDDGQWYESYPNYEASLGAKGETIQMSKDGSPRYARDDETKDG